MKLISLNTWGGRAGKEGLLSFLDSHKDVDIFCLQEVWSAPYLHLEGHSAGGLAINHDNVMVYGKQEMQSTLVEHEGYFRPHLLDDYGLMMFVNRKAQMVEECELFIYKEKGYIPEGDLGNHARNIQYAKIAQREHVLTVINFHGLWNGKGKGDSAERIQQSKNILAFTATLDGPYVLCGDFNLTPDTESLKLFETAGLRNLIKEYGITSTRTSHYTKPEKYADYVFITKGIKVVDFKVLPDEVSDHAPLYLEIE